MKSITIKQFTKATQNTTAPKNKDPMLNSIHKRYLICQAEASKRYPFQCFNCVVTSTHNK